MVDAPASAPDGSPSGSSPTAGAAQYQSLYRRYRPQRFLEVRGQDLTATTLRNAVRDGRIVHAYLFSGPRGTGKTSTARILAKALNCLEPEEGEPCGRCESCVEIARGASLDVHELDAASNNGVDAMRDLVSRASLATPGKRKVYIIDEVHMLSTAASNALLKTLEEPPEHVVFVLATTDPQKVLPTIRSRTQHFEFHLLEQPVLEQLLSDVAADAGLELPADGIDSAVRRGHGSARDALSVLDQVVASGIVEDDSRYLRDLVQCIAEQDAASALRVIALAITAGFDAQRLAVELVETLREQFLASVARRVVRPEPEMLAPDGRALLPPARCVRALELIGKSIVDMREALDPRTTLEVAMVRLTDPEVDDSTTALLDRVERLERRIGELESTGGAGRPSGAPPPPPTSAQPAAPAPMPTAGSEAGGGRPALGAYLSDRPAPPRPAPPRPAPPRPSSSAAPGKSAAAPAPAPAANPGAVPAAGAGPGPGAGPRAGAGAGVGPGAGAEGEEATQAPSAGTAPPPTRDDLVTAWADNILAALKPRARAVYQVGRWLSLSDGVAVFALPNAAHVQHAAALQNDVAAAISAHLKTHVRLEIVTDAEAAPGSALTRSDEQPAGATTDQAGPRASAASPAQLPEPELDASYEDDGDHRNVVSAPHDSASWAEHRLREVFPGAEEVGG